MLSKLKIFFIIFIEKCSEFFLLFKNLSFDKYLLLYVISYFFLIGYLLIEGLIFKNIPLLSLALFFILKGNQKNNNFLPYGYFFNLSHQTSHYLLICLIIMLLLFGIPRNVYCMPPSIEIPVTPNPLNIEARNDAIITVLGFTGAAIGGARHRTRTPIMPLGDLAAIKADGKFGFISEGIAAVHSYPTQQQIKDKETLARLLIQHQDVVRLDDENNLRRKSDELQEQIRSEQAKFRSESMDRSARDDEEDLTRFLNKTPSIEEQGFLLAKIKPPVPAPIPVKGFWESFMDCFSS